MGHYYDKITGEPHHFVQKKSGPGLRPSNIKDCRENLWVPGVTEVLKVLDKPALTMWKVRQGIYAVTTAPDVKGEPLDAKIERVLGEGQDREEAAAAADRGSSIHDAVQAALNGKAFDSQWIPYVEAVIPIVKDMGKLVWTEKVLVNAEHGYAGRADLLVENDHTLILPDIKTCKTMPKKDSWPEHKLQSAAYAACIGNTADKHILTANIYLSTVVPGEVAFFIQEEWQTTFNEGFLPLLKYWRFANGMGGL